MTNKKLLGKKGEDIAASYLAACGMEIINKNYQTRSGEIDLIAKDGSVLVFIEVKTASSTRFGPPETWVDRRKQAKIIKTAQDYLYRSQIDDVDCRFDVVAVYRENGQMRVKHIKDAFWLV